MDVGDDEDGGSLGYLRDDGQKLLAPLDMGKQLNNAGKKGEWTLMPRPLVIDSGAAETVLPDDWFTEYPLIEGEETKKGQFFVCADGTEIENM